MALQHNLSIGHKTLIMGVMNMTPDSFSRDGRLVAGSGSLASHVRFALNLARQGADIIDIGGESSRPGAQAISAKQECDRILPLLKRLASQSPVPLSIDTYKPEVAQAALDEGVCMVNNIMGTKVNKRLLNMVRDYGAWLVLMHMRGIPKTMRAKARYKNLIPDIISELRICLEFCLETGIKKDRIIVDPGIGFAKTPEQNLEVLNRLQELKVLGFPVLVGTSRKSFISGVLGEGVDRVWGTAATVAVAIARGADIVRVHDVASMKQVAAMTDAIVRKNEYVR